MHGKEKGRLTITVPYSILAFDDERRKAGLAVKIQLSDHFTYGRLLRFTLPSVIMMIFTSIYGVVDGIFVSNFAGKQTRHKGA